MPVPVRPTVGLLLLLAAGTGCAAAHDSRPQAAATTASPTATPAPTAADGRNVQACRDGNCEIAASGPVDIPVHGHGGTDTLSLVKIRASDVKFTVHSDGGGSGSGTISTGCTLMFYESGSGTRCQSGGVARRARKTRGVLAVQVLSLAKGTAIVRLVSGPPGRPPSSLVPRVPKIHMPDFG